MPGGELAAMIALYKGISPVSRAIRLKTWSCYSHAAWITRNDRVIEAWMPDGVRSVAWHERHTPGTPVDVFDVDVTDHQRMEIELFLSKQIGKPYDFRGIAGFAMHRPQLANDQDAWFCSELVFAACLHARVELLRRIPPYKVSPGLLAYSPRLTLIDQLIVPNAAPAEASLVQGVEA